MEMDSSSMSFHKPRIISWTLEEDAILRDQVRVQGTENWPSIAASLKDRTSRQCRRRWYTYLNTECKKGGWSQEEDALLCEAQRIYGNKWTEISKVVSGRTDNAVKNRFNTLSKKRTKHTIQDNENENYSLDCANKRIGVPNSFSASVESELPTKKKIKGYIPILEKNNQSEIPKTLVPLSLQSCSTRSSNDYQTDDMNKMSQSFSLNNSSSLYVHIRDNKEHPIETNCDQECSGNAFDRVDHILEEEIYGLSSMHQGLLSPCRDESKISENTTYGQHSSEYNSPFHTVSPFLSFADMIPSPKFSASERRFLMDLFDTTSPSSKLSPKTSNEPSCKKQLLHSL
ncbi:hypothetical protein ZOSMA_182G00050 [Zostera marina]|uniref:Uncharacterized protein n=1 Tax=Zostera marina TaxID=29655 RepID=A0A0K9PQS0_ZOSMR|nr:hypothetical protein ZOSMA_182G00050 [Zostera marina]